MMADVEIDKMIWLKRCSNYASLVPLALYLPIGLLLGIVRFFIFLHACFVWFILPERFPLKRLILRIMLTVTGLPISIQGSPALDSRKKIFIANHVSNLDPFILAMLNSNTLAVDISSSGISCSKGTLKTYEIAADKDQSDVIKDAKEKVKESTDPLLFFPERLKTNGKNSLLKFSSLPFELDCPIQPVTVQAYRYLFDIHVSTHSSSVYKDIVWCFLTPMTLFKVKYLPLTEQKRNESKEEFASRVQSNMARSLGLSPSDFSHHDVIEHVKNTEREVSSPVVQREKPGQAEPREATKPPPLPQLVMDDELKTMLRQVQEVLPDTPAHCILADLKETRDVDITITNILEEKVKVTALPEISEMKGTPAAQSLSLFKATKFESNARNRQLSFAERKQAMLEAARLKYKQKHGL